jgi:uncharacterized membrane protein YraQ (UPF0718 family)
VNTQEELESARKDSIQKSIHSMYILGAYLLISVVLAGIIGSYIDEKLTKSSLFTVLCMGIAASYVLYMWFRSTNKDLKRIEEIEMRIRAIKQHGSTTDQSHR